MKHNHLSLFVIANHTHKFLKHKPTFQWDFLDTFNLKQNYFSTSSSKWENFSICFLICLKPFKNRLEQSKCSFLVVFQKRWLNAETAMPITVIHSTQISEEHPKKVNSKRIIYLGFLVVVLIQHTTFQLK